MSITQEKPLKIPTQTLPENWKRVGAEHFNISESAIEKIVYGKRINDVVFKYMLQLAEGEMKRRDAEAKELEQRINALTK